MPVPSVIVCEHIVYETARLMQTPCASYGIATIFFVESFDNEEAYVCVCVLIFSPRLEFGVNMDAAQSSEHSNWHYFNKFCVSILHTACIGCLMRSCLLWYATHSTLARTHTHTQILHLLRNVSHWHFIPLKLLRSCRATFSISVFMGLFQLYILMDFRGCDYQDSSHVTLNYCVIEYTVHRFYWLCPIFRAGSKSSSHDNILRWALLHKLLLTIFAQFASTAVVLCRRISHSEINL